MISAPSPHRDELDSGRLVALIPQYNHDDPLPALCVADRANSGTDQSAFSPENDRDPLSLSDCCQGTPWPVCG